MVDFHTHILPGIDDGSKTAEESLQMLAAEREQGIDVVAATPHFYAQETAPLKFFERRQAAFEALKAAAKEPIPTIRLGAEVWYYQGISRMRELPAFRLEGTRLLLLEMPTEPWTDYMLGELSDLSCAGTTVLMLAHIDRYLKFQRADLWEELCAKGILMQVNTSFFLSPWTRRRALRMLSEGTVHFIGSDCHNLTSRTPDMAAAEAVIREKLGDEAVRAINVRSRYYLRQQIRI